ncbi:nucleoid-associated protein [Thiocapsa bogorovii]|uniref:nucleoid-associated protein n=1 Tax=Thiocapsa bogorovii TaxID=521689 RepID=UPI001E5DC62C|nr:nucleoid-associated protein [Thiocapsa bogorovii]UHD14598.1 nucleoid-associated protein [Thiocapsa bogorovii]
MPIQNIIIHEVSKEPQGAAALTLRNEENPINEHAERVSSKLAGLFTGVNIGGFRQPEEPGLPLTAFESLLQTHFDGSDFTDFVAFSRGAATILADALNRPSAQSAKGGYLLMNHYTHQANHFLSVVMLRMRQGISLGADLSFAEVEELNLDTLHMAGRINLTEWRGGASERYIAFKIGRQARDVTQYFSDFIGCREYTAAKLDTRHLVEATKTFCERRYLSEAESVSAKRAVSELCRERIENEQPVLIEDISNLLDARFPPSDEDQRGMLLAIAQDEYGLTNRLSAVDKNALRSLVRYQGKTRQLSISFDADLLEQGVVQFDPASKQLTIKELPESLLADLDQSVGQTQ